MIVRRLSAAYVLVLAATAGSGCIVNAAPDEGASTAPNAQRTTETVPVSPADPQQPTSNQVVPSTQGDGFQIMSANDPSQDPPPPRPWVPGPNAVAGNVVLTGDSTQKPSIGGAKSDDGSKPTK